MVRMGSNDEFLRAFGAAFGQWSASGKRVELTADFGTPEGDAEKQHRNSQTVHDVNTSALNQLFVEAATLDIDDVDLARAATVSPLELGKARDSLG